MGGSGEKYAILGLGMTFFNFFIFIFDSGSSYVVRIFFAILSHEKSFARLIECVIDSCFKLGSVNNLSIKLVMLSIFVGLKVNFLSSISSAIEEELLPITGAPHFIASKIGKPNPSIKDGKIKRSQQLYKRLRSSSEMKPVKIIRDLILEGCADEALVYDPFLGSGTTLIACEQVNRRCRGIELDPAYVDIIIKRWENFTGEKSH